MRTLTRDTLRGTWATTLLPLASDDSIDYGRLADELAQLLDAGLDGIYTNGTAGEFHTLNEDEYDQVNHFVAAACTSAGTPFQLGASHMSGQISLRRIRSATACKPAAIQVILPDWCALSPDETLWAVERMIREADPIPLVLYNPPHAKTLLTPAQFGRLATSFPGLIGIKVAGGDVAWFAQMRAHVDGLAIFVSGHRLASGLRYGAAGAYSNVACMTPYGAVRWYKTMLRDAETAIRQEQRLNAFLDRHIIPLLSSGYGNAALDKALSAIGGWAPIGTRVRWPHRSVPEDAIPALRRAALEELPEFFPAAP